MVALERGHGPVACGCSSSAIRSRWPVETPGLQLGLDERQHLGHDPAGAAHLLDLWPRLAGDHAQAALAGDASQRSSSAVRDGLDRLAAVDRAQDARAAGSGRRPRGTAAAGRRAGPGRRRRWSSGRWYSAEPSSSQTPGDPRRVERLVVRVPVRAADPAAAEPVGSSRPPGSRCRARSRRLRPRAASAASSARAWASVRGKPSRMTPRRASGSREPIEQHPDRQVVGHELAAVHVAASPRGRAACPACTAARNMSPVARCSRPSRSARIGACVPLPAPGPPSSTSTASSDESFVVAHHQLRLDLLHRLDDDADDDEDAGAAEAEAAELRQDRRRRCTARRPRCPGRTRRRS